MRFKIDENLPAALAAVLAEFGHNAVTSPEEGLTGRPDEDVWEAAVREQRALLTQDLDFSDVRRFAPGTHPGLVLIRLGFPSRKVILDRVRAVLASEDVEGWKGCFIVVSDRKTRVRRP